MERLGRLLGRLGRLFPEVEGDVLWPPDIEPHPNQLQLFGAHPVCRRDPLVERGFGPFTEECDRALICDAVGASIPAILTTDVRSFWTHREWLYEAGIEVWRPRELWVAIDPRAAHSTVA